MARITQRIKVHLLLGISLAIACSTNIGCESLSESTFKLAGDSRMPKWVVLAPKVSRADVSLTMSYYIRPWGNSARFILQDKNGQVVKKIDGKVECKDAFQLKNTLQRSPSAYPTYEPITVNGTAEIIEHKKMEPIFYVTDDAAVWKQYESIGCG